MIISRLTVSVLSTVILATSGALAEEPVAKPLLNDKSLDQWEYDPQYWRVSDAAIAGEIPEGQTLEKNTWMVWRGGELANFELRLQVKLSGAPGANSGIQFRCQVADVDHVSGYQADLDMGATWLGRIYDEHGRALLVERGCRVHIDSAGQRHVETLAPANQYAVLFRENAWNDYRIVAIGERIAVFVNGTLFSDLLDQQKGERDLSGALAFQLHSGPTTRVEIRNILLEELAPGDARLGRFSISSVSEHEEELIGIAAKSSSGRELNLGFETGDLTNWTATGTAFQLQPVADDGIANRWPGQTSRKRGRYFIGGYENVGDGGLGTLTSEPFTITHPFASFLFSGGDTRETRAEIIPTKTDAAAEVIFTAVGNRREEMRRVLVDLRKIRGQQVAVRLVDESVGPWGHLNFDDFRFHEQRPQFVEASSAWRSTNNPLLHHLVPNRVDDTEQTGRETIAQMYVPPGFSVDVIAAEPAVHQPIAFTFDARGRLWVAEGHSYPVKRPPGQGLDRIVVLADKDADGQFESRHVFIEGLNLVSGLQVGHGGVWVGAAPQLLFIPDKDGDDQPDSDPQVLLDGFGYADTHETLNSFIWGPDGWLYGNQGVFNQSMIGQPGSAQSARIQLGAGVWRYHPTQHRFEVFAHGGSNQWGLDFDDFGQLFMTHCRSAWAQGSTTHVLQGGHYWNQMNSGYASFISSDPVVGIPHMKNYLLASARYGHGEGGAGKRGSRQVYGGHSHVGTMIYLGDNWPHEYRNHLFSHNLHGHQINHQVNLREQGGYNTVHAGYDVLFCGDRQYIGVDLQYGPDGAVYISDWYDPRHCHNPDTEQWDRGNGRIYRMKFDASHHPVAVDYAAATDDELVRAQLHENDWHVRMARLVLSERAANGTILPAAIERLRSMALSHTDVTRRLRGLWTLHAMGAVDRHLVAKLCKDESEYVRGWTVQLAVESLDADAVDGEIVPLAQRETSLLVRRYLATALPLVSNETAWRLAELLASQSENVTDRDLPLLVWYGIASLMDDDLSRAFKLAEETAIPAIRDYVFWYASRFSDEGREAVARQLAATTGTDRVRLLGLFENGLRGMRGLAQPTTWSALAPSLYDSTDTATRTAAESLGAVFEDERLFVRMRDILIKSSDARTQRHALTILAMDSSRENLPHLLKALDNEELALQAILMLKPHNDAAIADALIERLPNWVGRPSDAALEVLCNRAAWSKKLVAAITAGDVEKSRLTAFFARQISNLGDHELNQQLAQQWGRLGQSSAARKAEITQLIDAYQTAPLWAYNSGAHHYEKLCATCHEATESQERIGPKLAGTGAKGVEYIVENIVDPSAVIGRDFQARMIFTGDGRTVSGLIVKETASAITVRTPTATEIIATADVEEIVVSPNSFMPEGLLDTVNDREKIELLKYLMSLR